MEVILNGQLIDVESKNYEYEGKKGISVKLCIYSDGNLYKVSVNDEQAVYYKELIGQVVSVTCKLFCKGQFNLKLEG